MKSNFKNGRKFSENLMGVEMEKSNIKMTKPVYQCHTRFDQDGRVSVRIYATKI